MRQLSAEEFYLLRDDRTNMLITSHDYHRLIIRLVAGQLTVCTYAGQVQLLVASNMLARWCRHIEFGFPDAPLVDRLRGAGYTSLHDRIAGEVAGADPFGRFVFQSSPSADAQYTLKMGKDQIHEPVDFSVDADDWHAWAARGNTLFAPSHEGENPAGPTFAACIAVADAFKVATGVPENKRVGTTGVSLFDFSIISASSASATPRPPQCQVVDLGNVQMVGVGSVGSALVYLLTMLPLKGAIRLIDHDLVEIPNLNRSPLFGIGDVDKPKVEVAAQHLAGIIPVELYRGRYDEFIQDYRRRMGEPDLLFPLANEYNVRSFVENNFPPIQVYGTTTPNWGINYHRHIPLQEDCSLCRFPADTDSGEFVCSTAKVETESEKPVDAALPFLSVGAAALIVADLLKLQMPGYPFTPNFAHVDFAGRLEYLAVNQKTRRADCPCARRSPLIHTRYISSTRFF